MSAIAGIVTRDINDKVKRIVEHMCNIQSHRGPYTGDVEAFQGACLGHRSHAPSHGERFERKERIVFKPEQIAIVFDGMLFNRADLAKTLGIGARAVDIVPDSELALRSYLRWGTGCAEHLDGVFAFAIWDRRDRTLYAARDRLGERPFFYHLGGDGEFTFASEIKAILVNGRVPRIPDCEAIYQYLGDKGFVQPRTPITGLYALQPGHWLRWHNGAATLEMYWDVPFISKKVTEASCALSNVKELVRRSVEERLTGIDTPALLFSGGVDSSLILGVMKTITDAPVKTYTVTTGLRDVQLQLVHKLAREHQTIHTEIDIGPSTIAENLLDFVWHLSTPTVGSILTYFCAKEARANDVTLFMNGHFAEWVLSTTFWLFRFSRFIEWIMQPFILLPEHTRVDIYDIGERLLRRYDSRESGAKVYKLIKVMHAYLVKKRGIPRTYGASLYPDEIASLFSPNIFRKNWISISDVYRDIYGRCPSHDIYEETVYGYMKLGLGINMLNNYESSAAASSVQLLTPLVDQQLLEYAQSISFDVKSKGGNNKYIPRELCRHFVSDECADQPKAGFVIPLGTWLRGPLWPIVDETLSRDSIERRGIFDHDKVASLCRRFKRGEPGLDYVEVWALVILEIWLRLHCDPKPEELAKPSHNWVLDLTQRQ